MEYQDRIFGECNIEEPVIVELIGSPALQRLKKIDQMGYQEPYFPGTAHSRFEHSVGVFLWLRKYGSSIEEQIAGLIHDISHGAFSHCLDYVLAQGAEQHQRYQDDILADFVKKSEIAGIIKKYGLDLDYILDENHFPLKEKPLPDLCADRIDYSIRDALCFGELRDRKTVV
jgi:HD superfamily phosphohydrolase